MADTWLDGRASTVSDFKQGRATAVGALYQFLL